MIRLRLQSFLNLCRRRWRIWSCLRECLRRSALYSARHEKVEARLGSRSFGALGVVAMREEFRRA